MQMHKIKGLLYVKYFSPFQPFVNPCGHSKSTFEFQDLDTLLSQEHKFETYFLSNCYTLGLTPYWIRSTRQTLYNVETSFAVLSPVYACCRNLIKFMFHIAGYKHFYEFIPISSSNISNGHSVAYLPWLD